MSFFFLLVSLPEEIYQKKILLWEMSKILLPMFSYRTFIVLSFTLTSLIHFDFIPVCGVRRWSSIFFIYLSNFPNSIYWVDCLYLIVCFCLFCLLCQILIDRKGVSLLLGSLFCSIDLYVCFHVTNMLFWLLWSCSIVWYQVVWYLRHCSSF